jgi:hypothetical protein
MCTSISHIESSNQFVLIPSLVNHLYVLTIETLYEIFSAMIIFLSNIASLKLNGMPDIFIDQ